MKEIFTSGDIKIHSFIVGAEDVAKFEKQAVHQVCATFTLAREIEWCTRLFVLDMLEESEEGIGTQLTIQHQSPALIGEEVVVEGCFEAIEKGEIICSYIARVKERQIAIGKTGQRILPQEKIKQIFNNVASN